MKYFNRALVFLIITAGFAWGVRAAELVMFESTMCEWCETWHEEIGVIYPKTIQGRMAPLRRLDIDDEIPKAYDQFKNIEFTPTFVLVENGRLLGRIIGYPGESFFWELLSQLMEKLSNKSPHACAGAGTVEVGVEMC